jgi:hypothetical protein
MTVGVVIRPNPAAANTVDDALWQARSAYDCGVRRVWFGQRYDLDALTLSAVIATGVPELHVGTAIVPINPRHPLLVASSRVLGARRRAHTVLANRRRPVARATVEGFVASISAR